MLQFPFYCPTCEQMADALADPIGLLFAGKGYVIECSNCGTKHAADITYGAVGQDIKLKGELPPDESEEE